MRSTLIFGSLILIGLVALGATFTPVTRAEDDAEQAQAARVEAEPLEGHQGPAKIIHVTSSDNHGA